MLIIERLEKMGQHEQENKSHLYSHPSGIVNILFTHIFFLDCEYSFQK